MTRRIPVLMLAWCLCWAAGGVALGQPAAEPPLALIWGKAYHILPETHNNESGYASLCEGKNGRMYVGTAKYGENAYLVEFDPETEKQRIVIDVHKVCGLTATGYAAQSKIHTPNFVGPSGKIYVGSKQGYQSEEDRKNNVQYPGGYVLVYNPATDEVENLGMPYPGEGVIDVTADEGRGLIYVCTCEEGHWMLYDVETKKYRELGPDLPQFMTTLVDYRGRAHVITQDLQLATYDPATDKVTLQEIVLDGAALPEHFKDHPPQGMLAPDGKTAYLSHLSDPSLWVLDLTSEGPTTQITNLGRMIEAEGCDSRASLCLGPDGRVYRVILIPNKGVHHLVRHDPESGEMEDLGVLAVKNPDYFDFEAAREAGNKWLHGFRRLPDGTLIPSGTHMAGRVAHDGTIYVTIIYPFTLLRIDPIP